MSRNGRLSTGVFGAVYADTFSTGVDWMNYWVIPGTTGGWDVKAEGRGVVDRFADQGPAVREHVFWWGDLGAAR